MPLLATSTVTATKDEVPERWMIFLHGILGSGANWRTFARHIVTARPEWGALLVDLRLHGESLLGFDPPHTLAKAAHDIVETANAHEDVKGRVAAVLGHSFGGKVGIELARQLATPLDQLFVIDSTPGARPDRRGSSGVQHIVELLTELPQEFGDRNAFTAWIEERGVSRPTAMWLAMNVRPIANTTRFAFRIDIAAVRTMMEDYFVQDLWPVLDHPRGEMQTHLISGGKSEVVDEADRAHALRCPRTTMDVIEDAGHWVHVDAPQRLQELVLGYLL